MSEITLRNLTQERDNAVAQLGIAFLTTEQLKTENERLIQENMDLKSQLSKLNVVNHGHVYDTTQTGEGLHTKTRRNQEADQDLYDVSYINEKVGQLRGRLEPRAVSNMQANGKEKPNEEGGVSATQAGPKMIKKNKKTRVVVEEYSESETSDDSLPGPNFDLYNAPGLESRPTKPETSPCEPAADATGDLTILSFLEVCLCHAV